MFNGSAIPDAKIKIRCEGRIGYLALLFVCITATKAQSENTTIEQIVITDLLTAGESGTMSAEASVEQVATPTTEAMPGLSLQIEQYAAEETPQNIEDAASCYAETEVLCPPD